jgi:hypothetical protein
MNRHVAHLSDDTKPMTTACGEPWQGWQAPPDLDLIPDTYTLPPHERPRPHIDEVRFCQACRKTAFGVTR